MRSRRLVLPRAWTALNAETRRITDATVRLCRRARTGHPPGPSVSARTAKLEYLDDGATPGIRRVAPGRYLTPDGRALRDRATLGRIASLAIPPAWRDVWICPSPNGHLQATGRDARGRKQYRYHPRWREVRDAVKYGRLARFARALRRIRAQTDDDLRRSGLPREKVLATVVQLLEKTLIRVGHDEYARHNHSFGLTTLRDSHVKCEGAHVHFDFKGKSGVSHHVVLCDARLARIVRACRALPGAELFQWLDSDGKRHPVGADDVNDYLRDIAGEAFTAKDFRTWAGTVLAAQALGAEHEPARSQSAAKRSVARAVESVASRLGNTSSVCRKSYIHPAVIDAFLEGRPLPVPKSLGTTPNSAQRLLHPAIETAVASLLGSWVPRAT